MTDSDNATILAVDIVGSTRMTTSVQAKTLDLFARSLSDTQPTPTRSFLAGDSALLLFPNPQDAWSSFRDLVRRWAIERGEWSPLLPALRFGLHMGKVGMVGDSVAGPAVKMAFSLAGSSNAVVLSAITADALEPLFQQGGLNPESYTLILSGLGAIAVRALKIQDLLAPDQYVVQLAPPEDLILHLARHPEALYAIPPRRFEEVVADLLSSFGYNVELTKQTRDNGIDIIAFGRSGALHATEKYLVQCKRNAPQNKVGVQIVHELLGVGAEEPHTGLVVVTTSTFTAPAKSLATKEAVRWRLSLRDYEDVRQWLALYVGRRSSNHHGA